MKEATVWLLLLCAACGGSAYEFALDEWECSGAAVCEVRAANCAPGGGGCLAMTSFGNGSALLQSPALPGAAPLTTWVVRASMNCAGLESGAAYVRFNDASLGRVSLDGSSGGVDVGGGWTSFEFLAQVSNSAAGGAPRLALGQYYIAGTCLFAGLSAEPAEVSEFSFAPYGPLGRRERVLDNGLYTSSFGGYTGTTNFHRSLVFFNTSWNGNCFRFWTSLCVEFHHTLESPLRSVPNITLTTNYFTGETLRVWASGDGGNSWDDVASIAALVEDYSVQLPSTAHTRVRFCSAGNGGSIYLSGYTFSALVDAPREIIEGEEVVLAVSSDLGMPSANLTLSLDDGSGSHVAKQSGTTVALPLYLRSASSSTETVSAALAVSPGYSSSTMSLTPSSASVAPGSQSTVTLNYHLAGGVKQEASVVVSDSSRIFLKARLVFWPMHTLLDSTYGEVLVKGTSATLWWCDSLRKVSKHRSAPSGNGPSTIFLEAAGNEYEAFQIVVSATTSPAVQISSISVSDLSGPSGSVISGATVRTVGYVFTYEATDVLGLANAWWPDQLVPLELPFTCPVNTNCPFWVLFKVPEMAAAGNHSGTITVQAGSSTFSADVVLRVFNFSIPRHTKLSSWFGLSSSTLWKYHNLTSASNDVKEAQWNLYLKSFEEHRISPSNPIIFHSPYGSVRWTNGTDYWQFSFSDFENNYKRYFSDEGFGFTTLSTSIRGTNTGNYHERNNGTITGIGGAYEWGSENHTKLFNEYGLALQGLLERTGMLDKTVLYPFDEPLPADYEYLRDLMGATHKAAPKLRRFLTTEPVSDLYGYVDVWCPKQDMVDPVITAQRQLRGEEVQSYLSGFPRTGRLDMFIDRPAPGLRLWLWLIFQQRLTGFLIWSVSTWTSSVAYNGTLQDPYEDPMSWSSQPPLHNWGNGDGRLLLPPVNWKTATEPIANATPIETMRWEHLRDGVEDWDTLTTLEELLESRPLLPADIRQQAASLLEIPTTLLSGGGTGYAREPTELFARRRAICEMIEKILVTPDVVAPSSNDDVDAAASSFPALFSCCIATAIAVHPVL